jgi:glycosyltransferase involved in cell wall biosynthesis
MEMIMTAPQTKPTLCIGVLTMNEALRIEQCLKSAAFADQVVVIDSGSTDGTRETAVALGAEVHLYADWQGFAVQRNRVLQHVKTDYVLFLDADELIPPELQVEIKQAVASGENAAWEVQWNQVAYGRALTWMKSTDGIRRLFKTSNLLAFEGVVHEGAELRDKNTPIKRFKTRLLHYSRETVYGSLQKLAQYVQLGAAKRAAAGKSGGVLRGFASAFAIFLKLYVFRRGFMCGPQGFLFCFFIALECFFRYAALHYDAQSLRKGQHAVR